MNKLSIKDVVGLTLVLLLLTACIGPPQRMEAEFGNAFEMAKGQQTLNPDASLNTEAVVGIDGQAGDAGFDSYRDSFINRPAATSRALNVGTSGGQ